VAPGKDRGYKADSTNASSKSNQWYPPNIRTSGPWSLTNLIHPAGIVQELTTRRVLTMEWMEGTKLPWGDDSERLISLGLECSTYQLLETGFLHAGGYRTGTGPLPIHGTHLTTMTNRGPAHP
jgi:ABC1 atypical kinase-like domain